MAIHNRHDFHSFSTLGWADLHVPPLARRDTPPEIDFERASIARP